MAAARDVGVTLIQARPQPGLGPDERLLQRPTLSDGDSPDWIIGHDRITGSAAKFLHENFFPGAARVQFIHTAPGQIEWHKEQGDETDATKRSEERERLQLDLAGTADLVVAVGPRLKREFGDQNQGSGHAITHNY